MIATLATLNTLQSFGFPWIPATKVTRLQELAGHFRSRVSPDAQNRAFAKNGNCIQILDTTLIEECIRRRQMLKRYAKYYLVILVIMMGNECFMIIIYL